MPDSPLTPLKRYHRDLREQKIFPDAAQAEAVEHLQRLYEQQVERWQARPGLLQRVRRRFGRTPAQPLQGLYFWGGVGRGKTYLMDAFFHCLPGERKLRMHFHRFMSLVHEELTRLRGEKNPLTRVADGLAARTDILCFDEFYVSDIGDAMILGGLLEALFERGVSLVATSNIEPDRLYERGLQRQRFLPAIALLKQHTLVVNVDGGVDYRLRSLTRAPVYHCPLDEAAERAMLSCFQDLSAGLDVLSGGGLEVLGREIPCRCRAEGLAWFEFRALCEGPRSAADYVEVAQLCHTVLLSRVPVLGESQDDAARRLINLVDAFYDHGVKLVISAAAPLESLYQGEDLAFPFARTRSRLLEMQSLEYLGAEHRP